MGAMLAIAATASLASSAAATTAAAAAPEGRHFLLEDKTPAPGTVRFLSQSIELPDGAKQTWVTLTRMGDFEDPRYGKFSITPAMLGQMVSNFDKKATGQDVFVDVAHKHSDGAAAKVMKLAVENGKLRALVEWTPFGIDAVRQRGFTYLSAEFHENYKTSDQDGVMHGCVLLGAGLTIRPVIKNLDRVQLSTDDNDHDAPVRVLVSPNLLKQLTNQPNGQPTGTDMKKHLTALLARLITLGFTDVTAKPFTDLATNQLEAVKDDEAKCLAVVEQFAAVGDAAMKQIKAGGGGVTITLAEPAGSVEAAVAKALADRDKADADAKTSMQAKAKLLSDTIAEGDKTLTPEGVKKFADDYMPLITAVTTDAQVKHLASLAIAQAQALSAAQKLVTLGYRPASGQVHITVDSSNSIKALQETTDKRLGIVGVADPKKNRFDRTGGVLLAANKEFAELCLAEFDNEHGMQLDREHKALAGGVGSISDVAIPKIAERTVLREALYNLISLNLVDVGTAPFTNVLSINYTFRDTSAAGVNALRRYELQAIRKSGVVQTAEETRPIPQKLSMQVSNELQLLMSAANIDFAPIAENLRNMTRIVGEDVEMINLNEIAASADEFLAVAVSGEVRTANVNGTNRIFPLAQFPVVKPRSVFDLKGVQQGSTVNPITVTLGGTVRSEYVLPADGSALAAGTYWVMDYNMGELQFVNELGAAVTPANATTLVVSYSTTANVNKFNTDLGSTAVDVFYDTLLFAIGGRKSVIEDARFYNPNMILMSGNVNNAVSQAKSFQANSARVATGLAGDGSVGIVKDMPVFRPRAPGSLYGDTRIVIGERGNSRFRMVKPWTMTSLEQARNSAGAFIDAQESFGTQWVGSHTPTQLKGAATSIILYSSAGRVARAA